MLKKINKLTIIAISMIIIVGIVFYYEEIKKTELTVSTTKVVAVKKYIKENTVITKDMVYEDERYSADLEKEHKNIVLKKEDVIGKRTVVPLFQNEIIKNDRLIENKTYMNNTDDKQISLELIDGDKALDLKKGNYIDVWIEPKDNKDEISSAQLLFEKLYVIEVDNADFENIKNTNIEEKRIPAHITVQLSNKDIELILNVNKDLYNIRISLYGEEKLYNVVKEVIRHD